MEHNVLEIESNGGVSYLREIDLWTTDTYSVDLNCYKVTLEGFRNHEFSRFAGDFGEFHHCKSSVPHKVDNIEYSLSTGNKSK